MKNNHCEYCGVEYHDSDIRPGTCSICGAPKEEAKENFADIFELPKKYAEPMYPSFEIREAEIKKSNADFIKRHLDDIDPSLRAVIKRARRSQDMLFAPIFRRQDD
jgi:hypothetical protein